MLPLAGVGLGIEAQLATEVGRLAESTQGMLRQTVKNNTPYEVTFWDPIRQKTVTKTVIPDFMPSTRIGADGRFMSARTASEAVLIADSKVHLGCVEAHRARRSDPGHDDSRPPEQQDIRVSAPRRW
jgi:hypothetical protein